jgi:hypothetical protein
MKSRQVGFTVELADLQQVMLAVQRHVIPHFEVLPHFLGLTVIKADAATRTEVVVTSFWDDGLDGSELEASRFIDEIVRVTGGNPCQRGYDTVYAQVRDSVGTFRFATEEGSP